jgi:serine/threonine-protein kinase
MSDLVGATLGHYRIAEKIGAGGMGVVYRAHDERLDRDVAVKVLAEEVARDEERLARFQREAKLLAALNHPNIATLHGLEEHEGRRFLVMELVEGETLAERIEKGPIPTDDALKIALQIVEGLEAAHERSIIHRDLKPANVTLATDDTVKILDFGLAKAWEPAAADGHSTESPTLTAQMTAAGVLLGTAAYMSPEQARGKPVDRRADIWAFGALLWEMLTSRRLFTGETTSDVLAGVLRQQPDWSDLPASTPAAIRRLLLRCLDKDPRKRLHDIADARLELEEARAESGAETEGLSPTRPPTRRVAPWLVACGFLGAVIGAAVMEWMTRGDEGTRSLPNAHVSVDLAEGTTLYLRDNPAMAISPDGRTMVWAAMGSDGVRRLYLRELDRPDVRPLQGTENAYGPFFSPDGGWIAYFDWGEEQLEKVTAEGGLPTRICDTPQSSMGGTWGDLGVIVFSRRWDGGLCRVSDDGGTVQELTEPDRSAGVKTHRFPQFLPGGHAVLFMVGDADIQAYSEARIEALDLTTGERRLLVEGGMSPRYAASGHLIFARQGTLMAAPFDVDRLQLTGQPKVVLDGVITNEGWGFAEYALAPNGLLLYAPGGPETYHRRLVQADRHGRVEPLPLPERFYSDDFAFSPDGSQLAITVAGANFDVWLWSLERQVLSRLTAGWNNNDPIWSPDSTHVIFGTDRRTSGASDFHWKPFDGSSPSTPLYQTSGVALPSSWSPDGLFLAYFDRDPETDYDVWVLPIDANMQPGTPRRIIASTAREMYPRFSPDGRCLVYQSDKSGKPEVYVQPFPGPGPKQQISSDGGEFPVWGRQGDEIFYVEPTSSRIMRAPVRTAPPLFVGAPEALFSFESPSTFFVLSPDGDHFVFLQRGSQARPVTQLRIVFNWHDDLERLVPTK